MGGRKVKKVLTAVMCMAFVFGIAFMSKADDAADLAALKAQMADMQKKIAELEAKQAAAAPSLTPPSIKFGGYFRGRVQAPEAVPEKSALEASEIAFEPRWDSASDKVHGEVHLWFYPNNTFYLESAMMTLDEIGIGKGSKLIAGKTRNFTYGITPSGGNRLTSNYSLYSDTFHHDRVTGFQSLNKLDNGKIDLGIALINGYGIGFRGPGIGLTSANSSNDPITNGGTTRVLANRDSSVGNSSIETDNNRTISMRIGGNVTPQFNIGLSGYYGKLGAADLANATAILGGAFTAAGNKHTMFGLDFRYKNGAWTWQGEGTASKIAGMKVNGWQSLVGYNFDAANMLYVQYGQVSNNLTPLANMSATWDKSQLSVSFKHLLNKKAWLQLEHEFNYEDVPAGAAASKVKNDTTFLEYFISL